MARPSRVVGLDIETTKTFPLPVAASPCHLVQFSAILDLTQQHNGTKDTEPVWTKRLEGQRLNHQIGIALLKLAS